jgi:hypothetical protein
MEASELYLTRERKEQYMLDFEKVLAISNDEFWDIDNGIKEILIRINSDENYQTLYSKKYTIEDGDFNLGGHSYLEITTTQKSWRKLLEIFKEVKSVLVDKKVTVKIEELSPQDNPCLNINSRIEIGCKVDPDYFRIKHMRISIETSELRFHDLFWDTISSKF